jgi:hypothetical protein
MSGGYKIVLYYLWIAPHLLLLPVAAIMYARRLHKLFPVFFIYTLYEFLQFVLLFVCYRFSGLGGVAYRYVFISTLAISSVLRFGIIQEIFNNLFRDYPRLERIAAVTMRWVTGLLCAAAVLSTFYSPGAAFDSVMVGVRLLDRSVTIIQAGLLLFLFLFSHLFGLSWRSYTFGIALGFSIFSSTLLAAWTLGLLALSEHSRALLDLLPTGSYHISVLVWLGYLVAAEKTVGAATYSVPELDQWRGELERTPQ